MFSYLGGGEMAVFGMDGVVVVVYGDGTLYVF